MVPLRCPALPLPLQSRPRRRPSPALGLAKQILQVPVIRAEIQLHLGRLSELYVLVKFMRQPHMTGPGHYPPSRHLPDAIA
jgi:hypothetical protein